MLRADDCDWRAQVRALRVPTLVMHGEADLLPFEVARELEQHELPGAHLVPVPAAGHRPFREHPQHRFTMLERFLAP